MSGAWVAMWYYTFRMCHQLWPNATGSIPVHKQVCAKPRWSHRHGFRRQKVPFTSPPRDGAFSSLCDTRSAPLSTLACLSRVVLLWGYVPAWQTFLLPAVSLSWWPSNGVGSPLPWDRPPSFSIQTEQRNVALTRLNTWLCCSGSIRNASVVNDLSSNSAL